MKELVIHVGAPKCGSSALQSSLEVNEKDNSLNQFGVFYPVKDSRGFGYGNAGNINEQGSLMNLFYNNSVDFSNFSDELDFEERDKIVISDELLFGIIMNSLKAFTDAVLTKCEKVTYILAVREPGKWLISDYSQHIKTRVSSRDFVEHVIARENCCDWTNYISSFASQISSHIAKNEAELIVTDYRNLLGTTEKILGLEKDFLSAENKARNKNLSLTHRELEAGRLSMKLALTDDDKAFAKLLDIYSDYDLLSEFKTLIRYLEIKYQDYELDIKNNPNIKFI